jgi:hypothetical protein
MNTAKAFGKKPCSCGECSRNDDERALMKLTEDVAKLVKGFEQATGRDMRFSFIALDVSTDTRTGALFSDLESIDTLNDAYQKGLREFLFSQLAGALHSF